jgi:lysophospholipase L1-like esterase
MNRDRKGAEKPLTAANARTMKILGPGLAFALGSLAQTEPRANQPTPRTDENSMIAHQQLLAKAKSGRIDVYFEGDSIVRRWGATDYPELLANWNANFFGWNAADFGWGADRVENILWRLDNGELDGVNPKVIVLLAGTNNVGNRPPENVDAKAADVCWGIEAVVKLMRAKAPNATIIVTGIFPRNDNMAVMPVVDRINAGLANMSGGNSWLRYLNINDRLADKEGLLFDGMMNADKLHPALKGYQVWADALKPLFAELLGVPAKTDLAPSPTGDPSARK